MGPCGGPCGFPSDFTRCSETCAAADALQMVQKAVLLSCGALALPRRWADRRGNLKGLLNAPVPVGRPPGQCACPSRSSADRCRRMGIDRSWQQSPELGPAKRCASKWSIAPPSEATRTSRPGAAPCPTRRAPSPLRPRPRQAQIHLAPTPPLPLRMYPTRKDWSANDIRGWMRWGRECGGQDGVICCW